MQIHTCVALNKENKFYVTPCVLHRLSMSGKEYWEMQIAIMMLEFLLEIENYLDVPLRLAVLEITLA